jgi:hypothetical protein
MVAYTSAKFTGIDNSLVASKCSSSHATSTPQVQPTINCSSTSWTMLMPRFLRSEPHAYMALLRLITWRTRTCGFNMVRHSRLKQRRTHASASGPHLGEGQTTRSKIPIIHLPLRTFCHRRHPEAHEVRQQGGTVTLRRIPRVTVTRASSTLQDITHVAVTVQ